MARKVNQAAVLRGRMGAHAPTGKSPNPKLYAEAEAELAKLMAERRATEATDRIAEFVERIVAKAPPLTAEQRERITLLLLNGGK
jgi:hypothetical protein